MAIEYAKGKQTTRAGLKVLLTGSVGVAAAIFTGLTVNWHLAPIIGWEVAATLFLGWTWLTITRLGDNLTSNFALREDPSRATTDVTVIFASVASLLALGLALVNAGHTQGSERVWQAALGVLGVVLSWFVVHTVYMLKYAELFYTKPVGGVDFEGTDQPTYVDFAYLAFTVGMCFQVSDTGYSSRKFRATTLKHAMLSYLFGTIIVATTINLIAGLL